MRKIKFRGKRLDNGQFVYGDLVVWGGYVEPRICSWDNGCIYDVKDIAQFVEVDSKGVELYEGDKVKLTREDLNYEKIFTVRLQSEATAHDGCWIGGMLIRETEKVTDND